MKKLLNTPKYDEIIATYKKHGIDLPLEGTFQRNVNRIYFINDFKDGEKIELYASASKYSAILKGYAFYISSEGDFFPKLININEIQ